MLPIYSNKKSSRFLLHRIKERVQSWLRIILSDRNSRNLLFFLLLNFSFAFVELFYGLWTNSLGLISDSFHMFFDCSALIAGLLASVVTKWRSNEAFTYGYVRAEIIAGFVNGLFLVFVAFFIFAEAIERAFEPPEVKHERLFIISVLGLLVNLVGIFVFQHGGQHHGHSHSDHSSHHGHSHSDHSSHHGHSHDHHDNTPLMNNDPYNFVIVNGGTAGLNSGNTARHSHNHDHHHSHSHFSDISMSSDNQILKGVFLHILADTLGSVGVIISALLMSNFGLMIADPLCSMFIAFMIMISVYPLIRDSLTVLMQRQPKELDKVLPNCYRRITEMEGVVNVQNAHFWTLCSGVYVGAVKVEVTANVNYRSVVTNVQSIFEQAGVKNLHVQIDYV